MGKYVIDEATLTAIGNSIRTKEGTTAAVPVAKMAERIGALEDPEFKKLVMRSIKSYTHPTLDVVGGYAFCKCTMLTSVYLPKVLAIMTNGFAYCSALTSVHFPELVNLMSNAFANCTKLESADLPKCRLIDSMALSYCSALKTVRAIPTEIGAYAFSGDKVLEVLDFTGCTAVPTLENVNAFTNVLKTCEIRVPASLLSAWRTATNWSTFASQIIGV